jgi:hypothetical protein
VPATVLENRDTAMDKISEIQGLMEFTKYWRRQSKNKRIDK